MANKKSWFRKLELKGLMKWVIVAFVGAVWGYIASELIYTHQYMCGSYNHYPIWGKVLFLPAYIWVEKFCGCRDISCGLFLPFSVTTGIIVGLLTYFVIKVIYPKLKEMI